MKKKLLVILYFITQVICSQTIDTGFNPNHSGPYIEHTGHYGTVIANDKIISRYNVNFGFTWPQTLNYDGSVDTSSPVSFPAGELYKYQNGKYIVSNATNINICNADGTLDTSFTPPIFNGTLSNEINDIAWQPDGKIIVVGAFSTVNGVNRASIVRLNIDGSVDSTFNVGTGATFSGFPADVFTVVIQPSGKCIIAGNIARYNGINKNYIVRINTDGSLDTTFNTYSGVMGFYGSIFKLVQQPDGKILTSGPHFKNASGTYVSYTLTRLDANGFYDNTFSCPTASTSYDAKMVLQPDGRIVAVINGNSIKRYNTNGSLDNTFTYQNAEFYSSSKFTIQPFSTGKFLIVASWRSPTGLTRTGMHRINSNGTIDMTFNPQQSANVENHFMKLLRNNKILIGANALTAYNETPCKNLIRLMENGDLDPSFTIDNQVFTGFDEYVTNTVIKEQADHKLIIGDVSYLSNTGLVSGSIIKRIARLNENGSLDNSFNFVDDTVQRIYDIEILNDGKILAIILYNNNAQLLRRLNSDGSYDTSHTAVSNFEPIRLVKFNTGTVFAYGNNTYVRKLNSDGTIDTAFSLSISNASSYKYIQQQSPDRYLVSYFTGGGNARIVRVTNTGALDGTFNAVEVYTSLDGDFFNPIFVNSQGTIFANCYAGGNDSMRVYGPDGNPISTYPFGSKFIDQQGCDQLVFSPQGDGFPSALDIKRLNMISGPVVPIPEGNSNQTFFQGQNLSNLVVVGQNILWYPMQSTCESFMTDRATPSSLPLPSSTPLVNGTTYYASQTINSIESQTRLPVTATLSLRSEDNENNFFSVKNPVQSNLEINGTVPFDKIEIFSIHGMKLYQSTFPETNYFKVDLSGYSNNMYIVKIYSNLSVRIKKIMKL